MRTNKGALNEALAILEMQSLGSIDDLKKQYRNMMRKWHPDLYMNDETERRVATVKAQMINTAYEFIISYIDKFGVDETVASESSAEKCNFEPDWYIYDETPGVFSETFASETFYMELSALRKLMEIIQNNKNDQGEFDYSIEYPDDDFDDEYFSVGDELGFSYDYEGGDRYIIAPIVINKANRKQFQNHLVDENVYNEQILILAKYKLIKIISAVVETVSPARIRLKCEILNDSDFNISTLKEIKKRIREEFLIAYNLQKKYYEDSDETVKEMIIGDPKQVTDVKSLLGKKTNDEITDSLVLRYYWSSRMKKYNGYLNFIRFNLSNSEIEEAFKISLNLDEIVHHYTVLDWVEINNPIEYYKLKTKSFTVYTKFETTKTKKGQIVVKAYFFRNDVKELESLANKLLA